MSKVTKVFIDAEFTGLHQDTTLISIGLVADNGDYFYAEFNDFDRDQIDDWLEKNVMSNLFFPKFIEEKSSIFPKSYEVKNWLMCGTTPIIVNKLKQWFEKYDQIEIWSDCLSYDWVLFNQLFGGAMGIPSNISYIPFDICTYLKIKGVDPDITREEFAKAFIRPDNYFANKVVKHNSLWDAYVIEGCFNKLEVMS